MAMEDSWLDLPSRFPGIELDEFVVMPNHIHGILVLSSEGGGPSTNLKTLSDVVGAYKSLATNAYIRGVKTQGWPTFRVRLFQVRFHDHIIRDEADLERIREYIALNPMRWDEDKNNPSNIHDK